MTISTNPQNMGTLFSILIIFDDYIFVYVYIYIYEWGFLKMGVFLNGGSKSDQGSQY